MASPVIIRLPRTSYIAVAFLAVGTWPLALSGGEAQPTQARIGILTLLLLIPLAAAIYVARTATFVNSDGIVVRALIGRRALPWSSVQGLSVSGRSIYAVLRDGGAVRLPCVRIRDLAAISEASAGRLPEIPEPTLIPAPSGRRR